MPLWTAFAAVGIMLATTAIIYPLDALSTNGQRRWVNVSGLLNGGCSDTMSEFVAAGIGNFGYGVAIALIGESFRRVYWTDGRRGKYWIGLLASLAFYLVIGFPTGHSVGTDIVHNVSTGVGVALLLLYASLSFDRLVHPIAVVQNLATIGMFFATVALAVTFVSGEVNKMGWNGFVASQLALGVTFLFFFMSWGFLRSGPNKPRNYKDPIL